MLTCQTDNFTRQVCLLPKKCTGRTAPYDVKKTSDVMKVIKMYREIAAIRGTNQLEKTRYNLQQQLFFTPKANHGV